MIKRGDFVKILKLTKEFLSTLFDPKISFYAASMSWSTLFFIIPLFVIIFSVVLHMPIFSQYYDKIHSLVASYIIPTNTKIVMNWIDTFVNNAHKMGYIGFGYIIIAAILFFRDYDYIVNDIFNLPRRSFFKAVGLYLALLILIPLILALIVWFITINSKISILKILYQFLLVWILIFIMFKITPQEKLSIRVVAISSFITSFVWTIAKTLFLLYVTYNKTYTTIYGAVSIVLFMFLWIYLSWVIFLHGLQLCNMLSYEDDE